MSDRSGRRRCFPVVCCRVVLLVIALAGCAGEYPQSTVAPSSDFGAAIEGLYSTIFWWAMFIMAVVWGVLAFVLIRYRDRPGRPEPRKTRGHLALEIAWTAGAAIIVVFISIPTIHTVFRTQRGPTGDALVVEVIGHQWWWEMRYPEQDVVTANELHLPVSRAIELRLRSADVIHSFWVPRLGGKRDLNPWVRKQGEAGPRYNRLRFTPSEPGVYHGQCAEFCGSSHALMGLRVVVESEGDFQRWVQGMNAPAAAPDSGTLVDRGRRAFMSGVCIACHAIEGTSAQGNIGPNLTRLGARTTIAAGVLQNSPENIAAWIKHPDRFKPEVKMPGTEEDGGGMPATGLSDEQVEAIAAYLWSLK